MVTLKLHSEDLGFCRVYYQLQKEGGGGAFYCLQDEGKNYGGVMFYRCTGDSDYMEPSHEVKPDPKRVKFEGRLQGEGETIANINAWLDAFEKRAQEN